MEHETATAVKSAKSSQLLGAKLDCRASPHTPWEQIAPASKGRVRELKIYLLTLPKRHSLLNVWRGIEEHLMKNFNELLHKHVMFIHLFFSSCKSFLMLLMGKNVSCTRNAAKLFIACCASASRLH